MDAALVQEAAAHAHEETPVRIKPVDVELEEDGVRIALTIIDTPGFGDSIDNDDWWVYTCADITRRLSYRTQSVKTLMPLANSQLPRNLVLS